MGQYHILCNFTKKEFVHPHGIGNGLKLAEQLYSTYGMKDAMFLLLASRSNGRGGGDLHDMEGFEIVGRWCGDKVGMVGDYTENDDMPKIRGAKKIYGYCRPDYDTELSQNGWVNITKQVREAIAKVHEIEFSGDGWLNITEKNGKNVEKAMAPDMVLVAKKKKGSKK